jgi:hypothetical protein
MANPSSRKKIARAARAGGSRPSGERRPLGFNAVIVAIVALGMILVFIARDDRLSNAHPKPGAEATGGDHWHDGYSFYTCVPDAAPAEGGSGDGASASPEASASASAPSDTSVPDTSAPLEATTTTINPASTTIPPEGTVPGFFQEPFSDIAGDPLGIHTHADSLIHIHPFAATATGSAAGRKARLGVFFDDIGAIVDDSQLVLPNGQSFIEGQTKCSGKDGVVQVARWNTIEDALADKLPNQVFTDDFSGIRLKSNGEYYVIAFLPSEERIPVDKAVLADFETKGAADGSTTTTEPAPDASASPGPDASASPTPEVPGDGSSPPAP